MTLSLLHFRTFLIYHFVASYVSSDLGIYTFFSKVTVISKVTFHSQLAIVTHCRKYIFLRARIKGPSKYRDIIDFLIVSQALAFHLQS